MFNHTTEVLPIEALLPDLLETLGSGTRCILEAAPGAGKTTRVPLALLRAAWLDGKGILMLEPRRMAARNAARYMASLLGEKVGQTVGYRVRLDSRVSASTRITVVTEGVLTRMLQDDPELQGVGCLIFDEFHERSLNADLGLALALDCQQGLRPGAEERGARVARGDAPSSAAPGRHSNGEVGCGRRPARAAGGERQYPRVPAGNGRNPKS